MKRELIKLGAISPQKLQLQKGDGTFGSKIRQSPVQVGRVIFDKIMYRSWIHWRWCRISSNGKVDEEEDEEEDETP